MDEDTKLAEEPAVELTKVELRDVQNHLAQRTPVIFEIVRRSGEEELGRPAFSLWWSGMAAGLSLGFSVLSQALLHSYLPHAPWSVLIEKLGYSVGFVIVILAHQQLFTENTITAVLPLMAHLDWSKFIRVIRLWSIVLVANVCGTILFSVFMIESGVINGEILSVVRELSAQAVLNPPSILCARGVAAGFLIASLVWILANVEGAKLAIIVLMTYLVALGDFSHVIAGSVEASTLVLSGGLSAWSAFTEFFLPTLTGNVLGGSALFAMLAYGQIHQERKAAPALKA